MFRHALILDKEAEGVSWIVHSAMCHSDMAISWSFLSILL